MQAGRGLGWNGTDLAGAAPQFCDGSAIAGGLRFHGTRKVIDPSSCGLPILAKHSIWEMEIRFALLAQVNGGISRSLPVAALTTKTVSIGVRGPLAIGLENVNHEVVHRRSQMQNKNAAPASSAALR